MKHFVGGSILLALALAAPAAEQSIVAPGHSLQKLADGFSFTEGPACDADGNIFFTDQPNDRIMEWSVDGKLSTFMKPAGRANGLCFDRAGNLWACADETNALWKIDKSHRVTVVVKDFKGDLLNGPNDIWLRPDGGAYFSDPLYPRPYWKRGPSKLECEGVYFLTPDGNSLTRVVCDLKKPNGLIGTSNGKILYVADIGANKTFRYAVAKDGTLKDKTLFCELGSDGMTIDNEGNVYLTGKGVTVFDKTGKQREHLDVPEPWTANICFGGAKRRLLFITASKCIYGVETRVKGVGSQ